MNKENHKIYFERYLEGTATHHEIRQLRMWLQNDPNVALFLENQIEASANEMSREQSNRLLAAIKQEAGIKPLKSPRHSALPSIVRWVAALFILPLLTAYGMYLYLSQPEEIEQKPLLVQVERGQKASLTLPDGSRVWLNSDTELSYRNDYNILSRSLQLKGEGYFEVVQDELRPFVVNANEMTVEVLGTTFGICAYDEDNLIYTSLIEGSVRLHSPSGVVVMCPNDRFLFDRQSRKGSLITEPNVGDYVGWKENRMRFDNQTLLEIATQLERLYNIKISFGSEKLKLHRFTGSINNNSLDSVFYILSLTAPILYNMDNETVMIKEDPRRRNFYH